jgi:hypothetical protein
MDWPILREALVSKMAKLEEVEKRPIFTSIM